MSRQQCWFMSIEAYFLGEFLVLKHETYIHGYAVMFATIRMVFTLENILWKAFIQCNCQYKVTDNVTARHKNCPLSAFDDHLGRDLFRVLMRPPHFSTASTWSYKMLFQWEGKGNTTRLWRRLHPHWSVSLLLSLCWVLWPYVGCGVTVSLRKCHCIV